MAGTGSASNTVAQTPVAPVTPNAPPVLAAIGPQTVDELQQLAFTASATDTAGQVITYSISGSPPPGATIDPSTGAFSWTPTEEQGPGTYQITITATDNGSPAMSDSETVAVTVGEVNVAPVLAAIGPKSATVGTELAFDLSAADVDLPANALTYSHNATFGTLAGASFAWTPGQSDIGAHAIRFTVSDGNPGGSDHEDVVITVSQVSDSTAPRVVAPVGQPIEATGTLTPVTLQLPAVSDDRDSTNVIVIQTNVTGIWQAVSSPVTHQFALGTHTIHWRATDTSNNTATATQSVTIRDTTAPAVVLEEPSPITLGVDDTYTEPGAVCSDAVDRDTPATITGDVVDTTKIGTYVVVYGCADAAGNISDVVERVITVSGADAPRHDDDAGVGRSGGGGGGGGGRGVPSLSPLAVAYDLCGDRGYLTVLAATYGDNLASTLMHPGIVTPIAGEDITQIIDLDKHVDSAVPASLYVFRFTGILTDSSSFVIGTYDMSGKNARVPLVIPDQCRGFVDLGKTQRSLLSGIEVRDSFVNTLPDLADIRNDGVDVPEVLPDVDVGTGMMPVGNDTSTAPETHEQKPVLPDDAAPDATEPPSESAADEPRRDAVQPAEQTEGDPLGDSESITRDVERGNDDTADVDDTADTRYLIPIAILERLFGAAYEVHPDDNNEAYDNNGRGGDDAGIIMPSGIERDPGELDLNTRDNDTGTDKAPAADPAAKENAPAPDREVEPPADIPDADAGHADADTAVDEPQTSEAPATTPEGADTGADADATVSPAPDDPAHNPAFEMPAAEADTPSPAPDHALDSSDNSPKLVPVLPRNATVGEHVVMRLGVIDEGATDLTYRTNMTSAIMAAHTGIFAWIPQTADYGTHYVEFAVSDGAGRTDTAVVLINVTTIANSSPEFEPVDPVVIDEHQYLRLDLGATDAQNDILVYSFADTGRGLPENVTLDGLTGVLEWMPSETQQGAYVFDVLVSDERSDPVLQIIHVTVTESNEPPILHDIDDVIAVVGTQIEIKLEASDIDYPRDVLAFATNMTVASFDAEGGVFVWLPDSADIGDHYAWFEVSDGRGGTDMQTVRITVAPSFDAAAAAAAADS